MTPNFRSIVASVLLLGSAGLLACGSDGGTDPDPDPDPDPTEGELTVTVTGDGFSMSGVTVELFATGGSTPETTQTTNAQGVASFSDLAPGAREVAIVIPSGYELDAGQTDRRSVNVTAGQNTSASFALLTEIEGEVVVVTLNDNLTFSPANVTIAPGTTIRWRSQSNMLHTVTPDGHDEWDEASLDTSGQIFHHTFDAEGTFDYYCFPHLDEAMAGTIVVEN